VPDPRSGSQGSSFILHLVGCLECKLRITAAISESFSGLGLRQGTIGCIEQHVPLLILDDLGMRKLGPTAAEELLEIVMRRYERASTLLTSNRPVEDWGKLLGDGAAVTAMLDRLLHHGHILKCGPRSWRTKTDLPDQEKAG